MSLKIIRKEIEAEREVGHRYLQMLSRAETLVPGAGREAIEVLLWDANAAIIRADVQNDRVVLDGTLNCQAVYRQGEENALRALSAKTTLSQVVELPGAQGGMLARVLPVVENVEARYENGHMVFLASLGLFVRVMKLEPVEYISDIEDATEIQTRYRTFDLTRLAAEATETAVLTERVELPQALDARAVLMDWGSVSVESSEPDLGGVRVRGKVMVEALIASGLEGRPAVLVKYPIVFDKLLELPEWLSRDACVTPTVRSVRTQLEAPEDEEEGALMLQADVHFSIAANLTEEIRALEDAYGTGGTQVEVEAQQLRLCAEAVCIRMQETVRGTVLIEDGAPAVGSVIAVRVQPNIAEMVPDGTRTRISGLMEATVLYMPGGSDRPTSARTQLPFEFELPRALDDAPAVRLNVVTTEANALMSDRLEMKVGLCVDCEARLQQEVTVVRDLKEGEDAPRRPGYVICWPEAGDDAWSIGRRYGISEESVEESAPEGGMRMGQPMILRITG